MPTKRFVGVAPGSKITKYINYSLKMKGFSHAKYYSIINSLMGEQYTGRRERREGGREGEREGGRRKYRNFF